ncbi:hypothetical protein [Bacteroides congonensis]|uniref:hypothetical protein n=1 Tax=Bacteroides congonensis TaxID=1871006 RepID=UPI00189F9720|nr:hypothetical protein [Bacteroides congonensis]
MKKSVLFLTLVALLSSCVSLEQATVTDVVDYSVFARRGIFVTESNSVNFDYKSLGSIVSITSGAAKTFRSFRIDKDKAFSEITDKLTALKADGLINLQINITYDKGLYYMTVTGMAIRRNEVVKENDIIDKNDDKVVNDSVVERLGKINDVEYTIFRETKEGVYISAERKLTLAEMKKIKDSLPTQKTLIQFYVLGENNDKPYAGFSYDSFVNYEK